MSLLLLSDSWQTGRFQDFLVCFWEDDGQDGYNADKVRG